MSDQLGNMEPHDEFEDDYTAGILDEIPEPVEPDRVPGVERIAPTAGALVLQGCVLTPERAIEDGYVLISGSEIGAVSDTLPDSTAPLIKTNGVILPGLIDLHGHPEYNVFAAWEPPRMFKNRYEWRRSSEYQHVIKEPWSTLKPLKRSLTRFAEARALIAGVTAIQGASSQYATKEEALVRNVDLRIFGEHRARSIIDLRRTTKGQQQKLRQDIDSGAVTAVYIHLAEGTDPSSKREFDHLVAANLLTSATVIIHGTALNASQLGQVRDAGAKLVWSPQSNLRLYGQTTLAGEALKFGIPLALGADWLPSGSPSLLGEIKVAQRLLAEQQHPVTAERLVRMVTQDAARIADLDEHLGKLEPGKKADILVLERRQDDPWRSVVEAEPAWVELVMIGGDLSYGREDWMTSLADTGELEPVLAWGKRMLLDTSYSVQPGSEAPRLAELRQTLIGTYPQIGPIFA